MVGGHFDSIRRRSKATGKSGRPGDFAPFLGGYPVRRAHNAQVEQFIQQMPQDAKEKRNGLISPNVTGLAVDPRRFARKKGQARRTGPTSRIPGRLCVSPPLLFVNLSGKGTRRTSIVSDEPKMAARPRIPGPGRRTKPPADSPARDEPKTGDGRGGCPRPQDVATPRSDQTQISRRIRRRRTEGNDCHARGCVVECREVRVARPAIVGKEAGATTRSKPAPRPDRSRRHDQIEASAATRSKPAPGATGSVPRPRAFDSAWPGQRGSPGGAFGTGSGYRTRGTRVRGPSPPDRRRHPIPPTSTLDLTSGLWTRRFGLLRLRKLSL